MIDRETLEMWQERLAEMQINIGRMQYVIEREIENSDPAGMNEWFYKQKCKYIYETAGKIHAIKWFKDKWLCGLLKAKKVVEQHAEAGGWKRPI